MTTTYTEVRAKARADRIMQGLRERRADLLDRITPRQALRLSVDASSLLAERLAAAEERAGDLERRLRALELRFETERKGFHYAGAWHDGDTYNEHDFATHQGSLWCCLEDGTTDRPGTSNRWQLAVKSGKDRRR